MGERLVIYLEIGAKRVFAAAQEWPGWCRAARHEDEAIEALLAYGPRYRRAMGVAAKGLDVPGDRATIEIAERLEGNATTDFGAPGVPPASDDRPLEGAELERQVRLLECAWAAFDRAVAAARGHELRKGPRGGGRDLARIAEHVTGAEDGYLTSLGRLPPVAAGAQDRATGRATRQLALENARARAGGEEPSAGRRRSKLWTPRYYIRRTAWHALDHAWELEDRTI